MTGHSNHSDQIDSYLSGNMNSSQQTEFEQMLDSDPLLKEEFNFQKDIVSGIKEYRKDQMKQRLNQITIGVGITGLILNSGMSKVLAAVGTIGVISFGTFWAYSEYEETAVSEEIISIDLSIDSPKKLETDQIKFVFEIPEETETRIDNNKKEVKSNFVPIKDRKEESQLDLPKSNNENFDSDSKSEDLAEKVKKANFVVPTMDSFGSDEETLAGIDITLPDSNQPVTTREDKKQRIEVEHVRQTKYDLHYKFFSGKLFLYGDFNEIPYELLEINSGESRDLYLYHDKIYYGLSQFESSVVPLKPIIDDELVDDLEIIRLNKIE